MLVHSHGDTSDPNIYFFKTFLAGGAVPAFFILSGYLGSRKIHSPDTHWRDYTKDKFLTLVAPYIFWNCLLLLLVLALKVSGLDQALKGSGGYLNVDFSSFESIVAAFFGIGRFPLVYQFWFLRDLIVVSFAAFLICRLFPQIIFICLILPLIPLPFAASAGYFLLGLALGKTNLDFDQYRPGIFLYCVAWLILGITDSVIKDFEIQPPFLQLGGAAFFFFASALMSRWKVGRALAVFGPMTFFVYAVHEPTQTLITKIWEKSRVPGVGTLLSFCAVPLIVFAGSVLGYVLLQRLAPTMLRLSTGNR